MFVQQSLQVATPFGGFRVDVRARRNVRLEPSLRYLKDELYPLDRCAAMLESNVTKEKKKTYFSSP